MKKTIYIVHFALLAFASILSIKNIRHDLHKTTMPNYNTNNSSDSDTSDAKNNYFNKNSSDFIDSSIKRQKKVDEERKDKVKVIVNNDSEDYDTHSSLNYGYTITYNDFHKGSIHEAKQYVDGNRKYGRRNSKGENDNPYYLGSEDGADNDNINTYVSLSELFDIKIQINGSYQPNTKVTLDSKYKQLIEYQALMSSQKTGSIYYSIEATGILSSPKICLLEHWVDKTTGKTKSAAIGQYGVYNFYAVNGGWAISLMGVLGPPVIIGGAAALGASMSLLLRGTYLLIFRGTIRAENAAEIIAGNIARRNAGNIEIFGDHELNDINHEILDNDMSYDMQLDMHLKNIENQYQITNRAFSVPTNEANFDTHNEALYNYRDVRNEHIDDVESYTAEYIFDDDRVSDWRNKLVYGDPNNPAHTKIRNAFNPKSWRIDKFSSLFGDRSVFPIDSNGDARVQFYREKLMRERWDELMPSQKFFITRRFGWDYALSDNYASTEEREWFLNNALNDEEIPWIYNQLIGYKRNEILDDTKEFGTALNHRLNIMKNQLSLEKVGRYNNMDELKLFYDYVKKINDIAKMLKNKYKVEFDFIQEIEKAEFENIIRILREKGYHIEDINETNELQKNPITSTEGNPDKDNLVKNNNNGYMPIIEEIDEEEVNEENDKSLSNQNNISPQDNALPKNDESNKTQEQEQQQILQEDTPPKTSVPIQNTPPIQDDTTIQDRVLTQEGLPIQNDTPPVNDEEKIQEQGQQQTLQNDTLPLQDDVSRQNSEQQGQQNPAKQNPAKQNPAKQNQQQILQENNPPQTSTTIQSDTSSQNSTHSQNTPLVQGDIPKLTQEQKEVTKPKENKSQKINKHKTDKNPSVNTTLSPSALLEIERKAFLQFIANVEYADRKYNEYVEKSEEILMNSGYISKKITERVEFLDKEINKIYNEYNKLKNDISPLSRRRVKEINKILNNYIKERNQICGLSVESIKICDHDGNISNEECFTLHWLENSSNRLFTESQEMENIINWLKRNKQELLKSRYLTTVKAENLESYENAMKIINKINNLYCFTATSYFINMETIQLSAREICMESRLINNEKQLEIRLSTSQVQKTTKIRTSIYKKIKMLMENGMRIRKNTINNENALIQEQYNLLDIKLKLLYLDKNNAISDGNVDVVVNNNDISNYKEALEDFENIKIRIKNLQEEIVSDRNYIIFIQERLNEMNAKINDIKSFFHIGTEENKITKNTKVNNTANVISEENINYGDYIKYLDNTHKEISTKSGNTIDANGKINIEYAITKNNYKSFKNKYRRVILSFNTSNDIRIRLEEEARLQQEIIDEMTLFNQKRKSFFGFWSAKELKNNLRDKLESFRQRVEGTKNLKNLQELTDNGFQNDLEMKLDTNTLGIKQRVDQEITTLNNDYSYLDSINDNAFYNEIIKVSDHEGVVENIERKLHYKNLLRKKYNKLIKYKKEIENVILWQNSNDDDMFNLEIDYDNKMNFIVTHLNLLKK